MNMKIRIYREMAGVTVVLTVPGLNARVCVIRQHRPGGYEPATIYWTGARTCLDLALDFANVLNYAVGIAERLDLNVNADIQEQG